MTITEKILAVHAGKEFVEPGDFAIMVGTSSRDCDLQKVILKVQ